MPHWVNLGDLIPTYQRTVNPGGLKVWRGFKYVTKKKQIDDRADVGAVGIGYSIVHTDC